MIHKLDRRWSISINFESSFFFFLNELLICITKKLKPTAMFFTWLRAGWKMIRRGPGQWAFNSRYVSGKADSHDLVESGGNYDTRPPHTPPTRNLFPVTRTGLKESY